MTLFPSHREARFVPIHNNQLCTHKLSWISDISKAQCMKQVWGNMRQQLFHNHRGPTISHLFAISQCLLWLLLFLRWPLSLAPCAVLCTRMTRASLDQTMPGDLEVPSYFTPELSRLCNFAPIGLLTIAIWEDYLIQLI